MPGLKADLSLQGETRHAGSEEEEGVKEKRVAEERWVRNELGKASHWFLH